MDRRQLADRIAAQVVGLGGVGVVLAVFFIAFYLIKEAAPLAAKPKLGSDGPAISAPPALIGGAELFTDASWRLFEDGRLQLHSLRDGSLIEEVAPLGLEEGEAVDIAKLSVKQTELAFSTTAGRIGVLKLAFTTSFEGETANADTRRQAFGDLEVFWFVEEAQDTAPLAIDAVLGDAEAKTNGWMLASYEDGRVALTRAQPRYNALEDATTWRMRSREHVFDEPANQVILLERGRFFASTGDTVHGVEPADKFAGLTLLGSEPAGGGRVVAARELIGRGSAIFGTEDGTLSRWLLQATDDQPIAPIRLQEYATKVPNLIDILPSARQRVFLARNEEFGLVAQGTSGVSLTTFEFEPGVAWMNLAPREDYLIVAGTDETFEAIPLDLGFPEVTTTALFGKLTYEGLPTPAYTYQSTGGSDEYEPKISLIPLIIGTIKGTIWALLPSIPLAVAGALYCARFLRGRARETIKPFVELLAGIPSVILGFVGGLYLAPALQDRLLALFLVPLVLAGATMLMGWLWARLPLRRRQRMHEGTAVFGLVPVYLVLGGLMLWLSPGIEVALFDTSFSRWAVEYFDIPYEQKNAVVVGLAMGFAVTPLIFTLAEDAYRNVPQTLADASLALGATPWQTARRVISPPARPGVVAAIMLGLGRAVGETMIVLMATGGTAITEWNPLQGFRALSANLATELPEAAKGESLYRTLFLSSLLLFALTFVINTLAEVIRVRGRKDL